MVKILHDNWSIRLGENRPDRAIKTFGHYAIWIVYNLGLYSFLIKRVVYKGVVYGRLNLYTIK